MAYELLDSPGGFEMLPSEERKQSWLETQAKGLATAPINLYLGAKQMFGGLDPLEQNILAQNKEAEKRAPIASFGSNVLTAVPTMMIPGANTVAGAGAISALTGMMQPVEGEQTAGNIIKGKAINTGAGAAFGAGGQLAANKVGSVLQNRLSAKTAEAAAEQSRNSLRDATLAEGRAAGYVLPKSETAATFLENRLESIAGKAALKQDATLRNQEVTNAVVRKALNLPENKPITVGALEGLRKQYGQAYDDVASLSKKAFDDVEGWKQANAEAKQLFESYNKNGMPDILNAAKAKRAEAETLQNWIDWHARSAGKPELVKNLTTARKEIAKTYTVERALNKGNGEIDAAVLGRLVDKKAPLSDGLETVGKFQQAFPKFMGEGVRTPAPGVSQSEALAAAFMGGGTALATGNPLGLLLAGAPLVRHPARALALSKMLQKAPDYSVGGGAARLTPGMLGLFSRGMAPAAGGLLTAE